MNRDLLRLLHIRDAINAIETYYTPPSADAKTRDAILRQIGIIGEAANHLSETIRQQALTIP